MTEEQIERLSLQLDVQASSIRTFLAVLALRDSLSDEIRKGFDDMVAICNSGEASDDEKQSALDTMLEVLFPSEPLEW